MAQASKGVRVYYGDSADGIAAPTVWTEIPDITSIPALGGDPNMLDSTTLAEEVSKTYVAGLKDPGGALSYGVFMSPEMLTATDAASTEPTSPARRAFAVYFPSPLNIFYWYLGIGVAVTPGETEVDGVISSTFSTSIESDPTKVVGKPSTTVTP